MILQCNIGGSYMAQEILGQFSRDSAGKLQIQFMDPAFVRADLIIFDRRDLSLHAVLHEASHFVGYVDKDIASGLSDKDEVILAAPHYFTGSVNLRSRVSII